MFIQNFEAETLLVDLTNKHLASQIPKRVIAHAFGLKAADYDRHATVQPELVRMLVEKLAAIKELPQGPWLDAGCGTGAVERQLRTSGLQLRPIGLDIARESLLIQKASGSARLVRADIDHLPIKAGSVGGIITASTVQWLDDPLRALQDFAASLRPGGVLAFSVFIAGSFEEILTTRSHFGLPTQLKFIALRDFVHLLSESGFRDIAHQKFTKRLYAPNAMTHLKEISRIGASAVPGRRMSRKQLNDFCHFYESRYRNDEGVPLTFLAVVGTARKQLTVNSEQLTGKPETTVVSG